VTTFRHNCNVSFKSSFKFYALEIGLHDLKMRGSNLRNSEPIVKSYLFTSDAHANKMQERFPIRSTTYIEISFDSTSFF